MKKAYAKKAFNAAARADIYQNVTDRVIADLERGVRPWAKPWDTSHLDGRIMRPVRHNGLPYSGINILMLWSAAEDQGFSMPTWMTYRQARELGGQVRKGEHGTPVVYASTFVKEEDTDDGDTIEKKIPFLKTYTVFNVEQIDGLPPRYYDKPAEPLNPIEQIEHAENFVAATGAEIQHRGTQALYSPLHDYIRMPPMDTFKDAASYYGTVLHELTHWTRHPSRLHRDLGRKKWGDEGYAREELVAELGAAFLCADLGLEPVVREDHSAYIDHWLTVLREDKRAIFAAAAHAQKAADYIHSLQPEAALNMEPAPEREAAADRPIRGGERSSAADQHQTQPASPPEPPPKEPVSTDEPEPRLQQTSLF